MFIFRKKKSGALCDERLRHIAFIMDGNGRWAAAKGLPRTAGHVAGAAAFRRVVEYCRKLGLRYMTVYAFSTENWSRPKDEVNAIMKLLSDYIDEAEKLHEKNNLRIIFIGDKTPFSKELCDKMSGLEIKSRKGEYILNIAMNYGSRAELVNAVNLAIKSGKTEITEADIDNGLYTRLSPPPDMIIRTANEMRLSNFLLWQAAYSEFYFTKTLWPDFGERDVDDAVKSFYGRKRKYGGLG